MYRWHNTIWVIKFKLGKCLLRINIYNWWETICFQNMVNDYVYQWIVLIQNSYITITVSKVRPKGAATGTCSTSLHKD